MLVIQIHNQQYFTEYLRERERERERERASLPAYISIPIEQTGIIYFTFGFAVST